MWIVLLLTLSLLLPSSALGAELAFTEGGELYVARADGSGAALVPGPIEADTIALSPDGRQVAYVEGADARVLHVVGVDGLSDRVVHRAAFHGIDGVGWHPDGRRLVFSNATCFGCLTDVLTVGADGSALTRVTSTPAVDEGHPAYSPDGSSIAYSACASGCSIFVMAASGGGARLVYGATPAIDPVFSPDGRELAFMEYVVGCTRILAVGVGGGDVRALTAAPCGGGDDYEVEDWYPSWSPAGDVVFRRSDYTTPAGSPFRCARLLTAPDTRLGAPGCDFHMASFRQPAAPGVPAPPPPPPPSEADLLARYVPELRYDALEAFRADHPAVLPESFVARVRTNRLLSVDRRGRETVRAVADPALATKRVPRLVLGSLGARYADGSAAAAADRIDVANDYAVDAQRMHAIPGYGDRAVGRVVRGADGSRVLQFWLFYYDNPKTYLGTGRHEGDWELVQVHLGADLLPVAVTAAQHGGGERCDWSRVERTAGGAPVVYVAEGSHASFFRAGHRLRTFDNAGGDGERVRPQVLPAPEIAGPLAWPGRWGGTPDTLAGAPSPPGPAFQGTKWTAPEAWSREVGGCSEDVVATAAARGGGSGGDGGEAASRRGGAAGRGDAARHGGGAPPRPRITGRLRPSSAVVDYAVAPGARALLVALDPAGDRLSPISRRVAVRASRGRVVLPRGLGDGPYTVRAAAYGRGGRRSRTVSLALP